MVSRRAHGGGLASKPHVQIEQPVQEQQFETVPGNGSSATVGNHPVMAQQVVHFIQRGAAGCIQQCLTGRLHFGHARAGLGKADITLIEAVEGLAAIFLTDRWPAAVDRAAALEGRTGLAEEALVTSQPLGIGQQGADPIRFVVPHGCLAEHGAIATQAAIDTQAFAIAVDDGGVSGMKWLPELDSNQRPSD